MERCKCDTSLSNVYMEMKGNALSHLQRSIFFRRLPKALPWADILRSLLSAPHSELRFSTLFCCRHQAGLPPLRTTFARENLGEVTEYRQGCITPDKHAQKEKAPKGRRNGNISVIVPSLLRSFDGGMLSYRGCTTAYPCL